MAQQQIENPAAETVKTYCAVHTNVETSLRCNKCGRLMCTKCAVRTPVGYRCKECVQGQQKVYFNAEWYDPVLQGVISLVLGGIAAALMSIVPLGFFSLIIGLAVGGPVGGGIADLAWRASGKRRSQHSYMVVAGGLILSALAALLFFGFSFGLAAYTFAAVGGAVGRLRLGK